MYSVQRIDLSSLDPSRLGNIAQIKSSRISPHSFAVRTSD